MQWSNFFLHFSVTLLALSKKGYLSRLSFWRSSIRLFMSINLYMREYAAAAAHIWNPNHCSWCTSWCVHKGMRCRTVPHGDVDTNSHKRTAGATTRLCNRMPGLLYLIRWGLKSPLLLPNIKQTHTSALGLPWHAWSTAGICCMLCHVAVRLSEGSTWTAAYA